MSIRDTSDSNGLSKWFLHGVLQFTDLESLGTSDPSAKQNISQRCLTFLGYQRWISVGTSGSGWEQQYVIFGGRTRWNRPGAGWSKKKGCFRWREGGLTWQMWMKFMSGFWYVHSVYTFTSLAVDCIRPVLGPCLGQDSRTCFSQWGCFPTRKKQTAEELVRIFCVTSCL